MKIPWFCRSCGGTHSYPATEKPNFCPYCRGTELAWPPNEPAAAETVKQAPGVITVQEARDRIVRWAEMCKDDRAPSSEWDDCDRELAKVLACFDALVSDAGPA